MQTVWRCEGRSVQVPCYDWLKNVLETVMQPCNACRELVGRPSSTGPHGDLAASSVSAFGPPGEMTRVSINWNCTVCGCWLSQNSAEGDPPNKWVMGERPLDWSRNE